MTVVKLCIFMAEHLQQNDSKCTLRHIWNGCIVYTFAEVGAYCHNYVNMYNTCSIF